MAINIKTYTYLKNKDLHSGNVYIFKDGRCYAYLGKDNENNHVFYYCASLMLIEEYRNSRILIANEEVILPHIIEICDRVFATPYKKELLYKTKNLPSIVYELYAIKNDYKKWILKNKVLGNKEGLPELQTMGAKVKDGYKPVKIKDLIPGKVYVTGEASIGTLNEGWRTTYIYLGRNSNKELVWLFIGTLDSFKISKRDVYDTIDVYGCATKNYDKTSINKRVFTPTVPEAANFVLDINFLANSTREFIKDVINQ